MDLSAKNLSKRLRHVQDLDGNLTFQLSRVAKLLENQATALLTDTELNLTAYRLLRIVSIFEAITISDLARLMVIDRAQISRAAAELEKTGYLSTQPDPTSKRKKLLVLDEKGVAILAHLAPAFTARRERLDALIGDDKLDDLLELMNTLSDYLYEVNAS